MYLYFAVFYRSVPCSVHPIMRHYFRCCFEVTGVTITDFSTGAPHDQCVLSLSKDFLKILRRGRPTFLEPTHCFSWTSWRKNANCLTKAVMTLRHEPWLNDCVGQVGFAVWQIRPPSRFRSHCNITTGCFLPEMISTTPKIPSNNLFHSPIFTSHATIHPTRAINKKQCGSQKRHQDLQIPFSFPSLNLPSPLAGIFFPFMLDWVATKKAGAFTQKGNFLGILQHVIHHQHQSIHPFPFCK